MDLYTIRCSSLDCGEEIVLGPDQTKTCRCKRVWTYGILKAQGKRVTLTLTPDKKAEPVT